MCCSAWSLTSTDAAKRQNCRHQRCGRSASGHMSSRPGLEADNRAAERGKVGDVRSIEMRWEPAAFSLSKCIKGTSPTLWTCHGHARTAWTTRRRQVPRRRQRRATPARSRRGAARHPCRHRRRRPCTTTPLKHHSDHFSSRRSRITERSVVSAGACCQPHTPAAMRSQPPSQQHLAMCLPTTSRRRVEAASACPHSSMLS